MEALLDEFLVRGEYRSTRRKPSRSREENQPNPNMLGDGESHPGHIEKPFSLSG